MIDHVLPIHPHQGIQNQICHIDVTQSRTITVWIGVHVFLDFQSELTDLSPFTPVKEDIF